MVCIGMLVPTAQARHSSAHMKAWWGDAQLSSADAGTAAPLREVPLHVESSPQNLPRRSVENSSVDSDLHSTRFAVACT